MKYTKTFSWLLVAVWAGVIFWLSSIGHFPSAFEDSNGRRSDLISDVVHVFLYITLCWFLVRAFFNSGMKIGKAVALGFAIAILYGITDEFHQSFVPGREAHVSDWLMDFAGAFIVVGIYKYKIKK